MCMAPKMIGKTKKKTKKKRLTSDPIIKEKQKRRLYIHDLAGV